MSSSVPSAKSAVDTPRFYFSLGELAEKLSRIPIAVVGRWVKGKNKFDINASAIKAFVANYRKRVAKLQIDFGHATVESETTAEGEMKPAAGWVEDMDDTPDESGILWGLAEFTDKARSMIEKKEVRYISPVFTMHGQDKRTGADQGPTFLAFGLTNQPFFDLQPDLVLSDGWSREETDTTKGAQLMSDKSHLKLNDTKDGFHVTCSACKAESMADLPEGFSDHFVPKPAVAAKGASLDATGAAPAAAKPEPDADDVAASDILTLSDARGADGRIDRAKLKAAKVISGEVFTACESEQLALSEVAAAVSAGKITPAQRPHFEKVALSDLETFRALVKDMKGVDLSVKGHGGAGDNRTDAVRCNEELEKLALEKQKGTDLSYGAAMNQVLHEHPELARARADEVAARKVTI